MITGLEKLVIKCIKESGCYRLGEKSCSHLKAMLITGIEELLVGDKESTNKEIDREELVKMLERIANNNRSYDADKMKALDRLAELKNFTKDSQDISIEIISFTDSMDNDKELRELRIEMEKRKGVFLRGEKFEKDLPIPK